MPVKVFLTGATGYIGGDALYRLHKNNPDFEYALLVRSKDKAKKVLDKFPAVRIITGGLDDSMILEREASWADIVVHTADSSDHDSGCTALFRWNNVHIHDLSTLFELLVYAALDPSRMNDPKIWGGHGYFFAENGEHIWGQLSDNIGREVQKQGFLEKAPVRRDWSIDEAIKSSAGFEAASWGMNSRGVAIRARKVLGWKPQKTSLSDEIPEIVRSEAVRLGL